MVGRNAMQKIDVHLLLAGSRHTLNDTEIFNDGLECGDVAYIPRFELRFIGLAIPFRKECGLKGNIKQ